jgi:hypothetical protein
MNTSLFHIQYQLEQRRVPFTRNAVLQLPKGRCGLYAIWLPDDIGGYERLYAGLSTTCIRRRLLQHLSDEQNPELRIQLRTFGELIHFSVAFTEDPKQTLALETELIRTWQPETNRYKLQ